MSSKAPSETALQTQSLGSSSGSVNHRPKISFSLASVQTEPKDLTAQYRMAMPPLFNALALRKDQWRIDSFKLVNDEPIVLSSHNEYRPGSYLHQWDATTWGKFSVIQMSDFHFLFMAPRDEKGQPLPHPWDVETFPTDTYLLKVSKRKEPGELSAYEDIDAGYDIEPMLAEAYVASIKAMGAAFHQEALARDKIEEFLKSRK